MIILEPIKTTHEDYPFIEELFLSAFPDGERRELDQQRTNIDEDPRMQCLLIKEESDAKPVGFLTAWHFGKIVYLEHFAVSPSFRNKGLGGKALHIFMKSATKPIVLEVEQPTDSLSLRRVRFYESLDFKLWKNSTYVQPPYPGKEGLIPMMLMTYGAIREEESFQDVKKLLYKEIYRYEN